MANQNKEYWFPAKTYGWGWGLPSKWQGWAVVVLYVALAALGAVAFPPKQSIVQFASMLGVLTALLLAVCWKTGEPQQRRG